MNRRLSKQLAVVLLAAGISTTFFVSCNDFSITLPAREIAEVVRTKDWECVTHAIDSSSTAWFIMSYAREHSAELLIGVQYKSSQFYPKTWSNLPGLRPDVVFREITVIRGGVYKWQVFLSKPDEHSARSTIIFTYLVGDRSTFTFTGAGVWRVLNAYLGRTYPCIVLKLAIPSKGSSAEVKTIVDSFRNQVVPELHRWLKHRYHARSVSSCRSK